MFLAIFSFPHIHGYSVTLMHLGVNDSAGVLFERGWSTNIGASLTLHSKVLGLLQLGQLPFRSVHPFLPCQCSFGLCSRLSSGAQQAMGLDPVSCDL